MNEYEVVIDDDEALTIDPLDCIVIVQKGGNQYTFQPFELEKLVIRERKSKK